MPVLIELLGDETELSVRWLPVDRGPGRPALGVHDVSGLTYSIVENTTLFDAPRESAQVTVTVTWGVQAVVKV